MTASTTTQFPLLRPLGQERYNGPDFRAVVGFCLGKPGRETLSGHANEPQMPLASQLADFRVLYSAGARVTLREESRAAGVALPRKEAEA